jgi:hypothetical protein
VRLLLEMTLQVLLLLLLLPLLQKVAVLIKYALQAVRVTDLAAQQLLLLLRQLVLHPGCRYCGLSGGMQLPPDQHLAAAARDPAQHLAAAVQGAGMTLLVLLLLPVAAVLMEYALQAMRVTDLAAQQLLLLLLLLRQVVPHPGCRYCGLSG